MPALVVDDSKAVRLMVSRLVEQLGFSPVGATNGQEALGLLDGGLLPRIALVDWNMPVMDGLAFVKALRAQERFAGMQVMMISSESELTRISQALDEGANDYLLKPFTSEALAGKLALLGL